VHLDRSESLVLVDWQAKTTPDHTLAGAEIHNNGAFLLARPDADEMINEVIIEYAYRVERWKTRKHSLAWSAWNNNTDVDSWCDWVNGPLSYLQFSLPTVNLVRSAMEGGSWFVPNGISYDTHPATAANLCGIQGWVWIVPEGQLEFALSAGAEGYRAWSQPVRETYTLTVQAVAAQALYGATVTDRKTGSMDVDSDPAWPPQKAQPQPGWSLDVIGDRYEDQDDETSRSNDLDAGYQWASWRIRGSQRATSVTVRTDLRPDILLAHTVQIDSYGLQAKGKARRLRYVLDAAPYLDLTIALSRGGGGATDTWNTPARPDTSDPGYPAPPATTTLPTHVGSISGAPAPPDPDDRIGWITNVGPSNAAPGAEVYSAVFRAQWPEVEDAAAEERLEDVPSTWELAVTQDLLTIA